jgi:type IV secretion system protein VirB10
MQKTLVIFCFMGCLHGQQPAAPTSAPALKERTEIPANSIQVDAGTHVLLSMINSVSTKQAVVGDRIYLETAFPVIVNGKMVVPRGSWVTGTVTEVRRPKRMSGHAELAVRFDSLTLPNGTSRSFKSDLGAMDAANPGTLDREHSQIKGPSDKKGEAETVLRTTAEGAAIGTAVGAASGHIGGGSVIGLATGAAGGLIAVLASRGPDAMLQRGSTVEMILDRPLVFDPAELSGAGDGRTAR